MVCLGEFHKTMLHPVPIPLTSLRLFAVTATDLTLYSITPPPLDNVQLTTTNTRLTLTTFEFTNHVCTVTPPDNIVNTSRTVPPTDDIAKILWDHQPNLTKKWLNFCLGDGINTDKALSFSWVRACRAGIAEANRNNSLSCQGSSNPMHNICGKKWVDNCQDRECFHQGKSKWDYWWVCSPYF